MAAGEGTASTKAGRWGWWIWIVVSALLALNGVGLYFFSDNPTVFEQDTGVSYAEVHAAYPSVAEQIVREGQTISILLTVVGLMAGTASLAGLRRRARWAWWVTGIVLAMLAYFVVRFTVFQGRADIGGYYLGIAVVALAGQLLSRRGLAA